MTRCLLLASLAAALSVPAQAPVLAHAAADEPVIREISVRPVAPVVGTRDSVRLVVDVVAKGVRGRQGVTVTVEPGAPPGPVLADRRPPAPDGRGEEGGPPAWTGTGAEDGPPRGTEAGEADRPGPGTQAGRSEPGGVEPGWPKAGRVIPATVAARLVTDGWQTWRFLPDKRLNRFYPAGAWTVTVTARGARGAEVTEYAAFQLRRKTRLSTVRAGRDGAGVRVSGRLKRLDPRGYVGYTPFRGQRVEIQWRPDPSAGWEGVAAATTSAEGEFSRIVPGREGGEWRAHFPGSRQYAPRTSKPRTAEDVARS